MGQQCHDVKKERAGYVCVGRQSNTLFFYTFFFNAPSVCTYARVWANSHETPENGTHPPRPREKYAPPMASWEKNAHP